MSNQPLLYRKKMEHYFYLANLNVINLNLKRNLYFNIIFFKLLIIIFIQIVINIFLMVNF